MITIEQMVQREVLCCMSSLVSTLAQSQSAYYARGAEPIVVAHTKSGLYVLIDQSSELAAPVLNYEEAAIQFGYELRDWPDALGGGKVWSSDKHVPVHMRDAEEVCQNHNLDPIEQEVYEHWAISQWLADKLIAQGERVDTDFASLNIWARTTTGQAIAMDGVVQKIYQEMVK